MTESILVVDDDRSVQTMLEAVLRLQHDDVRGAGSVDAATAILQREPMLGAYVFFKLESFDPLLTHLERVV